MSEAQTPSTGAAPSAEAEKNRIEEMGAETDLGARSGAGSGHYGELPSDIKAGGKKRKQT